MAESSAQSPLARLVLFIVCLAIIGGIVAGILTLTTGRPLQNLQQTPENDASNLDCRSRCQYEYSACEVFSPWPRGHCMKEYNTCTGGCQ